MGLSRMHYEAEIDALHRFYRRHLRACPESEVEPIRSRLAALRAAARLPESQLRLLSFLATAALGQEFRALARKLAENSPAEMLARRGTFDPSL